MQIREWIELFLLLAALLLSIPLLGTYIARIFSDTPPLVKIFGALESLIYRVSGIQPQQEMCWKTYCKSLIIFNLVGFIFLLLLQLFQQFLPLNPQNFEAVPLLVSLNTSMSFVTNTNWQSYSGETTMSNLSQMLGLTVQNFLSAATGLTLIIAFIRGIRKTDTSPSLGNFWQDLTRGVLYLFLPLSLIFSLILVNEGVVQTLSPYLEVNTLEGGKQVIPLGNVASQVAIKQLGTNGGGFFGVNSAHPFENPTAFSNFFETLALFLIPGALCYTYGLMTGYQKHSHFLLLTMFLLLTAGFATAIIAETAGDPITLANPFLEGKEVRFGNYATTLWATLTTATANGSTNGMLESMTPLAGGVALFNMMLGEIVFGGIGVGLCSLLMFVLMTVFLSGLMVGRTPEYFGKKIEKKEIQLVITAILLPGIVILFGTSMTTLFQNAVSSIANGGPHGLTEILYAFTSTVMNNGSAFSGLNVNTAYFNSILTFTMLFGRLVIVIPTLALAGSFTLKHRTPPSAGTFSTENFLFLILLLATILIVGALTFFPALALGPIIEQLLMSSGKTFSL